MVVVFIVPADLGDDDPLDERMYETACEEDARLDAIRVAGRRLGHGRACRLARSLLRPMVLSGRMLDLDVWFRTTFRRSIDHPPRRLHNANDARREAFPYSEVRVEPHACASLS